MCSLGCQWKAGFCSSTMCSIWGSSFSWCKERDVAQAWWWEGNGSADMHKVLLKHNVSRTSPCTWVEPHLEVLFRGSPCPFSLTYTFAKSGGCNLPILLRSPFANLDKMSISLGVIACLCRDCMWVHAGHWLAKIMSMTTLTTHTPLIKGWNATPLIKGVGVKKNTIKQGVLGSPPP